MSSKKNISESDRALFRDAVGEVRGVVNDRIDPEQPRPGVQLRQADDDDAAVMRALLAELDDAELIDNGEHLAFTRPGVQRSVLRKLRAGRYAVQAEIDLHGLTVAEARNALAEFLLAAQAKRRLCVRIIHGKGRRKADHAPRLKPAVNQWLQRNRRVLAFCSARPADGGTGAVYVLLQRD